MNEAQELLELVKKDLQSDSSIDLESYNQFIATIETASTIRDNYIYIIIENSLNKYRIERFYLSKLNESLKKHSDKYSFKIVSRDKIKEEVKVQPEVNAPVPNVVKKRNLRSDYTFNSFVTGEANREAYTFAVKIAENLHVTINPFYIFGDVGLGKTHLMTAIGHYVLDQNPDKNVIYTTAQQFVEDFIKAKNRNQKDFTISDQFDEYYRSADVLLVDDIQYLEQKQASQDEFFKLFEYLFENGRQMVITSDRPADELNIIARLKSRFAWGLQADLKKPNLSLRCSIVKSKLKDLITDETIVPDEVVNYIALNFDQNVRVLEGAVRRLVSYCVAFNFDYTLENAEMALASIFPKEKAEENNDEKYATQVKNTICKYFNLPEALLTSASRKKELVYARDITVYILKNKYSLTFEAIGLYLGKRDHSTIVHSYDKMTASILTDDNIKEDYNNIVQTLDKIR